MASIRIRKVDELPDHVDWSYPVNEIDHLLEQVEDGDRDDDEEFLLYENRLYEQLGM